MSFSGAKPTIPEVKKIVVDFLQSTLDEVHQVHVTKMAVTGPNDDCWEVEAEIFVVNSTIKALGLRVSRPVLDRTVYKVYLASDLRVLSYAPKETADA